MDFTKHLKKVETAVRFSQSDFACWFNRSRLTVRSWLIDGRQPRGFQRDEASQALKLLEAAFDKGWLKKLDGVSAHDRPRAIKLLRSRAASSRVLRSHSPRSRLAHRLRRPQRKKVQ